MERRDRNGEDFHEIEHPESRRLSEFTSYRVGGPAKRILVPRHKEELVSIIRLLKDEAEDYYIIGGGSNLLVSDRGFDGAVILMTECCLDLQIEDGEVHCGSGIELLTLISAAINSGLGGLERLAGIPGTVGGALMMNAGAYGSEISDRLKRVEILDENGKFMALDKDKIGFSYRNAPGLENKFILSAEFELQPGEWVGPAKMAVEIMRMRAAKQPLEYPSAGSVFKRNSAGPAGMFIEWAGLKGMRLGGAQISEKHANFIINRGGAKALEILTLMKRMQKMVYEKYGIELELEQRLIGFTPEELENPEAFL